MGWLGTNRPALQSTHCLFDWNASGKDSEHCRWSRVPNTRWKETLVQALGDIRQSEEIVKSQGLMEGSNCAYGESPRRITFVARCLVLAGEAAVWVY